MGMSSGGGGYVAPPTPAPVIQPATLATDKVDKVQTISSEKDKLKRKQKKATLLDSTVAKNLGSVDSAEESSKKGKTLLGQ